MRVNVYVPNELHAAMKRTKANWSAIACEAFAKHLGISPPSRPISIIDLARRMDVLEKKVKEVMPHAS